MVPFSELTGQTAAEQAANSIAGVFLQLLVQIHVTRKYMLNRSWVQFLKDQKKKPKPPHSTSFGSLNKTQTGKVWHETHTVHMQTNG